MAGTTESQKANEQSGRPDELHSEMLAEYNALRSEMVTRIELRFKSLELAIPATGVFIAAVATGVVDPFVLLFYPLLGLGLAIAWTQNDIRVGQMAEYIQHRFETPGSGFRWEHNLRETYKKKLPYGIYRHFTEFTAAFVFAGTQVIATALALVFTRIDWLAQTTPPSYNLWPMYYVMGLIDLLAMGATLWLVWLRRKGYRKEQETSQTSVAASKAQET